MSQRRVGCFLLPIHNVFHSCIDNSWLYIGNKALCLSALRQDSGYNDLLLEHNILILVLIKSS